MTQPLPHGPAHEARPEPVLALDVDGTLAADPRAAGSEQALRDLGYQPRDYSGPGQAPVSGTVWLNPLHATWLRELLDRGMHPAWATSWGQRAADWIAPNSPCHRCPSSRSPTPPPPGDGQPNSPDRPLGR